MLYNLTALFLQLSILSLYHRLTLSRTLHRILYVVAFITTLVAGARVCIMAYLTFGKVLPSTNGYILIYYLGAVFGIVIDFLIWILPMPILCSIRTGASTNMTRWRKVGLIISFGVGLTACMVCLFKILHVYITKGLVKNEAGWLGAEIMMFEAFELCLGISSACVPMLRTLALRASLPGREVDVPQMQRPAQIDEIYSPIVENAFENNGSGNTLDGGAHQKTNPWIGRPSVGEEGIFELGQVAITIATPELPKRDTKQGDLQNPNDTNIPTALEMSSIQIQHSLKIHTNITTGYQNTTPTEQSTAITLPASPPSVHHAKRPSISSIRRASSRLSDRMIMATAARPYNGLVGDTYSEIRC